MNDLQQVIIFFITILQLITVPDIMQFFSKINLDNAINGNNYVTSLTFTIKLS